MHTNMIKHVHISVAFLIPTFNPLPLGQAAAVKQEIKEELCQD